MNSTQISSQKKKKRILSWPSQRKRIGNRSYFFFKTNFILEQGRVFQLLNGKKQENNLIIYWEDGKRNSNEIIRIIQELNIFAKRHYSNSHSRGNRMKSS